MVSTHRSFRFRERLAEALAPVLSEARTVFGRFASFGSRRRIAKALSNLHDDWGQPIERDRDFAPYSSFMQATGTAEGSCLDDATWKDLNLDQIFAHIDRTLTTPGELVLYRMLRTPNNPAEVLEYRDSAATLLRSNVIPRESLQLELSRLGRTHYTATLIQLLWEDIPVQSRFQVCYFLLAILAATTVGLIILSGVLGFPSQGLALICFSVVFAINMFIHYRTRRYLTASLFSIRYLSNLVTTARRVSRLTIAGLEDPLQRLQRGSDATAAIPRRASALAPDRGIELVDVIHEYVAILLLAEVRSFYSVLRNIRAQQCELRRLFQTLGELDSLQAIASFRNGLRFYVTPEFTTDRAALQVQDVFHPLLDAPVVNSLRIAGKGCFVTGSNMSGKSTFLRTIGVSVVLAQTLFTCPARRYKASSFRVVTSMGLTDDLLGGKSCYYVEAERLLVLVRDSRGSLPALLLIDELLRGTNTRERLAASQAVLGYMANDTTVVIAATHDLDLIEQLRDDYDAYHFTDDLGGPGLAFDYKLRPGCARSTNAIRLLEFLGFPGEIVGRARANAFSAANGGNVSAP